MINPTSISTMPSAHGSYQPVTPVKHAAAIERSESKIENRPPPQEPSQPLTPSRADGGNEGRSRLIDVYA